MRCNAPDIGGLAMFKQVDPLPCSKGHASVYHRDRQADWHHRRLDVGRHIIGTFEGMGEIRHRRIVRGRDKALEEGLKVALYIRVGVFLDQERAGGVADEKG